jgi:peptidoglycan/xylan/chitin deacetylase (PgdA/CDA1 family)
MRFAIIAMAFAQDFSGFPEAFSLAPPNPQFSSRYDLSRIPSIRIATPLGATGPIDCADSDPSICSFQCTWCYGEGDIVNCPRAGMWGLTFDDGPSTSTIRLLDYLRERNIKASFFVVGSQVVGNPQLVRRMFEEGHHVGVHTWSHRALSSLSNEQIISELEWSVRAVEQVIGIRPTYYRPPYGDIDDRVRAVSRLMGLKPVKWGFNSTDWLLNANPNAFTPDQFKQRMMQAMNVNTHGVIDLSHDLTPNTVQWATTVTIPTLLEQRMIPMSVPECLGDLNPYEDKSVTLPRSMGGPPLQRETVPSSTGSSSPGSATQKNVASIKSTLTSIIVTILSVL